MSKYLFVQLESALADGHAESMQWLYWDTKAQTSLSRGNGAIDALQQAMAEADISTAILIVPGEQVRSLDVTLPNKSKAAISTVAFQLEEHLSGKLEDLHIVSDKPEQLKVTSLVTSTDNMIRWQAFIEASAIDFQWLVADYSLIPFESQIQRNSGLSAKEISLSASSEHSPLSSLLMINSAAFRGVMNPLVYAQFRSQLWPDQAQLPQAYILSSQATVERDTVNIYDDLLLLMAKTFSSTASSGIINLLTSKYKINKVKPRAKYLRRSAVLIGLLGLSFIGKIALENWQLTQQIKRVDQQMVDLYKAAVPDAQKIINPVAQMRARLKQAQPQQKAYLLPWLATIAPILHAHNISLISLKYDNQPLALRLQLEANNYASLEAVVSQLNQHSPEFIAILGTLQQAPLEKKVTSILTIKDQ